MALPQQKFREIVFQLLYSQELGSTDQEAIIKLLMKELQVTKKSVKEAFEEVDQIIKHKAEIDAILSKFSTSYSFERIQTVEKNILRLALYEFFHEESIPKKVVISEGMRLARKFGSPESANFVNALLDTVYQNSNKESLAEGAVNGELLEDVECELETGDSPE